jgi:Asp-tRNA(Asn)/Glu-tRNA(Gln) amidotransferase A subunit family amidase
MVGDSAETFDTIAGYDPTNPGSTASGAPNFGRLPGRGVRGLRVAFVLHSSAHPEVTSAQEHVTHVLRAEGAEYASSCHLAERVNTYRQTAPTPAVHCSPSQPSSPKSDTASG